MKKTNRLIVNKTETFVKEMLANAEGGHDWWHIERVRRNSLKIAKDEDVDMLIVELAALLHDIADSKFHGGNEEIGPATAKKFLQTLNVDKKSIQHIVDIIRNMSFKNSFGNTVFKSRELMIVQDADRLDAIGAIGIARSFNYGGHKRSEMYNPDIKPVEYKSKEEYKKSSSPTINHFYEKLLLLKDGMNTGKAKEMAQIRHDFMLGFLEQFYSEWNAD